MLTRQTLLAASILVALVAVQVPTSAQISPPPIVTGAVAIISLDAGFDAGQPTKVTAGETMWFTGYIQLNVAGVEIVNPVVVPPTGGCVLHAFHIEGSTPTAAGFVLANMPLLVVTPLDTTDPAHGVSDLVEVSMEIQAPSDAVGDKCTLQFEYTQASEAANLVPLVHKLQHLVDIVAPPPLPVPLGAILSQGGDNVWDGATATPATVQTVPITVLAETTIKLTGATSFKDNLANEDDYGRFWIKEGSTNLQSTTLRKSPSAGVIVVDTLVKYGTGPTTESAVSTEYCLAGDFFDGGLWDNPQGYADTCVTVQGWKPSTGDAIGFDLCEIAERVTARAQLDDLGVAVEWINPAAVPWEQAYMGALDAGVSTALLNVTPQGLEDGLVTFDASSLIDCE